MSLFALLATPLLATPFAKVVTVQDPTADLSVTALSANGLHVGGYNKPLNYAEVFWWNPITGYTGHPSESPYYIPTKVSDDGSEMLVLQAASVSKGIRRLTSDGGLVPITHAFPEEEIPSGIGVATTPSGFGTLVGYTFKVAIPRPWVWNEDEGYKFMPFLLYTGDARGYSLSGDGTKVAGVIFGTERLGSMFVWDHIEETIIFIEPPEGQRFTSIGRGNESGTIWYGTISESDGTSRRAVVVKDGQVHLLPMGEFTSDLIFAHKSNSQSLIVGYLGQGAPRTLVMWPDETQDPVDFQQHYGLEQEPVLGSRFSDDGQVLTYTVQPEGSPYQFFRYVALSPEIPVSPWCTQEHTEAWTGTEAGMVNVSHFPMAYWQSYGNWSQLYPVTSDYEEYYFRMGGSDHWFFTRRGLERYAYDLTLGIWVELLP